MSGSRRASWPSWSPATTRAPRRANSAATRLLPLPMPPIRPMTSFRSLSPNTDLVRSTGDALSFSDKGFVILLFTLDRLDPQVGNLTTDRMAILGHAAPGFDLDQ